MDEILENTLANRFGWALEWLCKKVSILAFAPRADGPVAVAACARFLKLGRRFTALIEQWQAGTLPVVVPASPRVRAVRVAKSRPPELLSRGVNWLRKLFPTIAPPLAGHLNQMVEGEPEIRALAAATPEAGRILRPMCHAVGLKFPAWLRLPRKPRGPRKVKPIPENETDEQADKRVARMSERAFINMLTPETEFLKGRPPHRIGYGRSGLRLRKS